MENLQLKNDVNVNKIKNIANKNKRLFNFFELFDAKIGLDEYYSIINNLNNGNNLLCIKIQFMSGNMNYRNYTIPCLFFNNILKLTFMPLYYDLFQYIVNEIIVNGLFCLEIINYSDSKFNHHDYSESLNSIELSLSGVGMSIDDTTELLNNLTDNLLNSME